MFTNETDHGRSLHTLTTKRISSKIDISMKVIGLVDGGGAFRATAPVSRFTTVHTQALYNFRGHRRLVRPICAVKARYSTFEKLRIAEEIPFPIFYYPALESRKDGEPRSFPSIHNVALKSSG